MVFHVPIAKLKAKLGNSRGTKTKINKKTW